MATVIAEFSYWSYGEFSKSAMISRPEVNNTDIEKLARRYAVKVYVLESSSFFLSALRMPGKYRKMIIRIIGENSQEVRSCVRDIILSYGKPDEVPFALNSNRRAGRAIIESLLREYPGR